MTEERMIEIWAKQFREKLESNDKLEKRREKLDFIDKEPSFWERVLTKIK